MSEEFAPIFFLKAMYEAAGLKVNIMPGADTRGARMYARGYVDADCRMLDRHHTAQPEHITDIQSMTYMTFNAPYPVMCNVYPHKDDPYEITICAAGPTYTAGRGGPLGDTPSGSGGNKYGWSWECPNNGVGEPWSQAMQETMVIGSAVDVQFFSNWGPGWSGDLFSQARIPAHFEWAPGRKIDPFGPSKYTNGASRMWDMDEFRADVRAKHAELYDSAPLPPPPPPIVPGDPMLKPCNQSRVDSRDSFAHVKLTPNEVREVWLTLPSGATGVVLNAVFLPKKINKKGWVSVCSSEPTPGGEPFTTINWAAGADVGQGQVLTYVDRGRSIWLLGNSECEFVIDVVGIYW